MGNIPQKNPWYLNVPAVLAALVLLGPLAYPLLWKSPAFNRFWKMVLTVVVLAATVYMVMGTWKIAEYVIQELQKIQQAYS